LVGPARLHGARSQVGGRTDDNRCPLVSFAEEGNVVSVRKAGALELAGAEQAPPSSRTRPSLGPETRARQSPLREFLRASCGASRSRWSGRFGIAVGQPHESGKNRHRGLVERTIARLAAWHRSRNQPREVVRVTSEKEGGHGHRPCEETRVPEWCPYVVFSCRSRQAASWPRISSHAALQKGWRYE
jgi:hypothetical protein